MFDAIIAGAGLAGVAAAYQLRGKRVLMLDAGLEADRRAGFPAKNLYDIRRDGDEVFEAAIGSSFESLHNIFFNYLSPKLKGPLMRYVTALPDGTGAVASSSFDATLSYSKGGLANAWGAGVLRFNDRDLRGFPVTASELDPFYDALTRHIGICGEEDDLSGYLGTHEGLLPPLALSPCARSFLAAYRRCRTRLQKAGFRAGRTRAAILSEVHNGREAYQFLTQDFLQPNIPAIYNPSYTLDPMIAKGEVEYLPGKIVLSYTERENGVEVIARDSKSGAVEKYEAKALCLAAGAINTARIVLAAHADFETKLPILDNPISFMPFVNPWQVGAKPDLHAFAGGELLFVYDGEPYGEPVQSSVYGLMGPLRADLIFEMPLTICGNLVAMKYLVPAITVLQTFYPDDPCPDNFLKLQPNGSVFINYVRRHFGDHERRLSRALFGMGFIGSPRLAQFPKPGSSIHYAGCLPMRDCPTHRYETDRRGKLFGSKAVFVLDGACFPRLPSKNLTFTIMANAMRIAEGVLAEPC